MTNNICLDQGAGASEDWTDADGKTCKEFEHGKMTEYMVILTLCNLI